MKTQQTYLISAAIMASIVGLVVLFIVTSKTDLVNDSPTSFDQLGGDFTLQSINGEVSLSDYRGKAVVMYFGFMSCPDVCPNSLSVIKAAFNKLSAKHAEHSDALQGLMISVDPKRDSLQSLDMFTKHFHPNIAGITGDSEQLKTIAKQYGASFAKVKDPQYDYLFEHVSRYYVIDQQGNLVDAMRHSTTPNELAARLSKTLQTPDMPKKTI